MLRELEEAVQRKFHVRADVSDTTSVANGWESRLHISQVWNNIGSILILFIINLIFFKWIYEYHIFEPRRERSEDIVDHEDKAAVKLKPGVNGIRTNNATSS